MRLHLKKIHLDLKVNWKLSRNQTNFKENFVVLLELKDRCYRSEVAPNIRYGETPDRIEEQFRYWLNNADINEIRNLDSLNRELNREKLFHSLRFGIESVFLSFLSESNNVSLSTYLELETPVSVKTSFSMPIIPVAEIKEYLANLRRFESLKIKVNAESGKEMLQEIKKFTTQKLRVDANEGWTDLDSFMRFQESLKGMNIELIEQPFPSTMKEEYKELKKMTPYVLLADESIEDVADFRELAQQFHAINIKLMKTGSLIRARDLLFEAKKYHLSVMIGCMIESSIGISYGMLFAGMADYVDLDGFLLIKDEPYGLVTESGGILSLKENRK